MYGMIKGRHLEDLITQEEIKEARKDLYCGKKLDVFNYRTNKIESTKIDHYYPHVIQLENNCSFTMVEYVMYKRNPNRVLGRQIMYGKDKND